MRISVTVIIGLLTAASGIGRLAVLGGLLGQILTTSFTIEQLVPWIIGALSAVIIRAILQYFKEMTAHKTAGKIQLSIRNQLYNHTSTLGISYVSNQRTGDQCQGWKETDRSYEKRVLIPLYANVAIIVISIGAAISIIAVIVKSRKKKKRKK